ncbi:MAG: CDP-alcohol phosphatidyltransferase family protein [Candidatus Paceibacterota bacterium]|jgi:phosphatidylglycerophosphate synthase
MRKTSCQELKKNYFKSRDTWTERFIFLNFSVFLAWLILKLNQSKKLPYLLTVGNLLIYLIGAASLYFGFYKIGGMLWFIAMVIDNIDGTIARFLYGQDPPQRGSLDLMVDSFAASIILLTIFAVMIQKAIYFGVFLVFLYAIFLFILYVLTSTVYRLRSEFPNRLKDLIFNKKDEKYYEFIPSFLIKIYFKIDKITLKYQTLPLPTACDSAFLIYVVLPLFSFHFYVPILITAIMFVILGIFQELIIIFSYFKNL